jgi:hypothetical protein
MRLVKVSSWIPVSTFYQPKKPNKEKKTMEKMKAICMATMLALALCVPAHAGDIASPGCSITGDIASPGSTNPGDVSTPGLLAILLAVASSW